jgi:hypothetical protein
VAEAIKYIPQNFNLDNPPYRDGFYTLPVATSSTWLVVRYQVVNPGVSFSSKTYNTQKLIDKLGILAALSYQSSFDWWYGVCIFSFPKVWI